LGPDGGDAGGEIVFEGTPEALAKCKGGFTGKFLKIELEN
jgi:excinuclease ABC subunit A